MNPSSSPTPARRRKHANVPPSKNPQRIVSAGQIESAEQAVPRATSDVTNSGRPGPSRPTIGQQQQKVKSKAPINTTVNDASDRKNEGGSMIDMMVRSVKAILPGQYEEELESLAIPSSIEIETAEADIIEANTFDLSEHFDPGLDIYDFDRVDDFSIFGQMPCERSKQPTDILKVSKSIAFSPFSPNSDSTSTVRGFKAVIQVQNTGNYNVTYLVESCSLKMFRIDDAIGYICPKSTKEIIITTNPNHDYKYEDVASSSFTVSGCPVLFHSQLVPEKLDALWNALSCQVLSGANVEHHIINWVYPTSDSMLDDYSILKRIQFQTPLSGNAPKIERLTVTPISALEFRSIWNGDNNPDDEFSVLKFKIDEIERTLRWNEEEFTKEQRRNRKIVGIGGLLMLSCFVGYYIIYHKLYALKQPDELALSWYENTCNTISDSFKSIYTLIFT